MSIQFSLDDQDELKRLACSQQVYDINQTIRKKIQEITSLSENTRSLVVSAIEEDVKIDKQWRDELVPLLGQILPNEFGISIEQIEIPPSFTLKELAEKVYGALP